MSDDTQLLCIGDDFGLTEEINTGILRGYQEGIISGASLVTNGVAVEQALSMKERSQIPLGVHLNLTFEKPLLDPKEIPSLIDSDGNFYKGLFSFLSRWITGFISAQEVKKEWHAQIQKLLNRGTVPLFLNSHQHLHMMPGLLDIILDLAKEFEISWIRNTFELINQGGLRKFSPTLFLLRLLARSAREEIRLKDMGTSDFFSGILLTEAPAWNEWVDWIHGLPAGMTEMGVHVSAENFQGKHGYHQERKMEEMLDLLIKTRRKKSTFSSTISFVSPDRLKRIVAP